MSIRVMLADDQTLVRQGICSLLELSSNITVVCQVNDGSEVVDSLVNAIESVHGGGTLVQPAVTERILRGLSSMAQPEDRDGDAEALSRKELEVLRMMAGGYSNKEISIAIHKSEGTVKNQVSSILAKLGVRDRTQAVLRAINLGLLQ